MRGSAILMARGQEMASRLFNFTLEVLALYQVWYLVIIVISILFVTTLLLL